MSIDIDDLIKKHVNGHEADIDPNEIWAGIKAKQNAKPRKRRKGLLYVKQGEQQLASHTQKTTTNIDKSTIVLNTNTNNSKPAEKTLITEKKKSALSSVATTSQSKILENSIRQLQPSVPNSANAKVSTDIETESSMRSALLDKGTEIKEGKQSAIMISASNEKLLPLQAIDLIATDLLAYHSDPMDADYVTPLVFRKKKWLFTAAMGYSRILGRTISGAGSQEQTVYRNDSENVLDALSGSLLLSYRINDKFSFSSGLHYQKDYELFEWMGSYVEDSQGAAVTADSQSEVPSSFRDTYYGVQRTSRIYNQYSYYGIPVFLKYNFGNSRIRTAIQAGITANVHKSFNGVILNQDGLPVELSTLEDEFKIGLKYSCALAMDIPVYRSWSVHSSLGYSYRKNTQRDLNLSYNYLDLRLGLQHQF